MMLLHIHPYFRIIFVITILGALNCTSVKKSNVPSSTIKVKVDRDTKYYNIKGITRREINESIERQRDIANTRHSVAQTIWGLSISNIIIHHSKRGCKLISCTVSLDLNLVYPRLETYAYLDAGLKKQWDEYMDSVKKHEARHVKIAQLAAFNLWKELQKLEYMNCKDIERSLKKTFNKNNTQFRKRDNLYDIDTNYGGKQGMIWYVY
jgi:predicted secreted Zn-dependent protease